MKEHIPRIITLHDVRVKMRSEGGLNTRIAVYLTRTVSTMWTAYSFALLAIVGLLAILGIFPPIVALLVVWFSQTFLQLCFLPILSVGQSVLGKHQEMISEKSYDDIERIMKHLDDQDALILKIVEKLEAMESKNTA